jgi:hypothetical protein
VRTRAGYWRDNAGRTVTVTDEAGDAREATVLRRFPGRSGSGEGDTFNVEFSDDGTVATRVPSLDVELGACDLDPSRECFHECPNYWQCAGSHNFVDAVEFTCGNLGDLQPFDFGVISESTATQLGVSIDANDDTGEGTSVIIGGYENTIRTMLPLPLAASESFLQPETMDSQDVQNAVSKFYDCVDRYNGSYLVMLEDIHRNVYKEGELYDMFVRQEEGCAPGYVGNLCHQCESGFTKSSNICVQCPAGYESIGYALIATFFVLFGAVIHIMIRSQYETTKKPGKRMSIRIKIFLSYFQVAVLVSKVLQSSDSLEGSALSAFFDAQASASPLVEPEPSSNQWLDCTFSAMTSNGMYFPWLYRFLDFPDVPPPPMFVLALFNRNQDFSSKANLHTVL